MQNHNFLYSKGQFNTPGRHKTELLESVLNGFYLLTNFVKFSILDVCRILENLSISSLDQPMLPMPWSSFSQRLYSIKKLLERLPIQWSSLSKRLYYMKKIFGGYQYNGLLFWDTLTQRNLVSELHLLHKDILQVSFDGGSTIY